MWKKTITSKAIFKTINRTNICQFNDDLHTPNSTLY